MAVELLPPSRIALDDLFDRCARCLEIAEQVKQRDHRRFSLLCRYADGEISYDEVQRHEKILHEAAEQLRNEYVPQIESLWPFCNRELVAQARFFHSFGAEAAAEGYELVKDSPLFANMVAAGIALAARGQALHIHILRDLRMRLLLAINQLAGIEAAKPVWNAETNKLSFHGKVVREVRAGHIAGRIRPILDQFQASDWVERVDAPRNFDPQTVREAVKSLNDGLRVIRFRSDGTGGGVIWEIRQP
jgi:hypothetical protein